jgi:hypothetical protein
MEESALALILKECLAAVEQGGEPADIAPKYPVEWPEILPLLEVAVRLRESSSTCSIPVEFLRDLGGRLASQASA